MQDTHAIPDDGAAPHARHVRVFAVLLLLALPLLGWALWSHADGAALQATLREQHAALLAWQAAEPFAFLLVFATVFVLVSALTLPGGTPLCLLAGSAFGVAGGAVVLGVASTLGALLSFLAARHLARERAERAFGHRLRAVDRLVTSRGGLRLFWLRVVPLVPFPVLNPLLGLSRMPVNRFLWPSLAGLTLTSVPYTWAGQSLGELLAGQSSWLSLAGAGVSILVLWLLLRYGPGARDGHAP
jgi:uncharacterized membrane protein YdjX (TVP38/TMEM64 family)